MTHPTLYMKLYIAFMMKVVFISDQASQEYSLQANEFIYVKKTNKACEK
jgi:hypothetical protein